MNVTGPEGGVLNVDTIKTDQIFIDNKLFPTSIIPFKINGPSSFVGTHTPIPPPTGCSACSATCPPATPDTPSGGLFALGKSFAGKITFCGIQGMSLNLAGLTLENDNDYALEFINCNQVLVYGGTVKSKNNVAVHVICSSNVTFRSMNTTDSYGGVLVENSYDVNVASWYMDTITGFAFDVECSNYLRLTGLDINNIGSYAENSLLHVNNAEMIFINDCAFYNINYNGTGGTKSIVAVENSFDVKISHVSILTTYFNSNEDIDVSLVHFKSSGSLVLGSFIVDGDGVNVTGAHSAIMNCMRFENCNNTFMAHNLMTDNYVSGDANAVSLKFHGISLENMTTFTMNSCKICTNYTDGGNTSTIAEVRGFYGLYSGNWYLSGNICNQNYVNNLPGFAPSSSVYGYELVDVSSTILLRNCSGNNQNGVGAGGVNVAEAGGFKIRGVNPVSNTDTSIDLNNCQANQNLSDNTQGVTVGFSCTYSNAKFSKCEAISNTAGSTCYGFLIPGIDSKLQYTVSMFSCDGNSNFSNNGIAYGLYAGVLDSVPTMGVEALTVKSCTFNSNGPEIGSLPPNPGYGIYLNKVLVSELVGNLMNYNNYALYINAGQCHTLVNNSALYNDNGFEVNQAPNSLLTKNSSVCNTNGFIDNTTGGNSYISNTSVGETVSYTVTGGGVINLYALDKTTGTYINVSGGDLTAFSNLQS
jgi:hypothetical protein